VEADRSDGLICDLTTRKLDRFTGGPHNDVNSLTWLDDKRFLFTVIQDKMYSLGLYSSEIGKLQRTFTLDQYSVLVPIGAPRSNPLRPIVWVKHDAQGEGKDGGLVAIDASRDPQRFGTSSGTSVVGRFPVPAGGVAIGYMADVQGNLAFGITAKDGVVTLHSFRGGKWVPSRFDFDRLEIVGNGEKAEELFVLGPREDGKPRALHRYDVASDQLGEVLFRDDSYDLDHVALRRDHEGKLLGLYYHQKLPRSVWFDERYLGLQLALEKALPNRVVTILGSDRAEKKFFIAAQADVSPLQYYTFDTEKGEIAQVTSTSPWLDPSRMQPMRGVTYKTRDGYQLDGYVTLPAGASKEKPVPLIVLPHGGPWVRDTWRCDPEVQFLASRGYGVFQPSYRGSPGYDWKFPETDHWAFRKMHNDVTDGVRNLLKTGLFDSGRIGIVGSSFGGYLAVCGAAYEPNLYRCAVTVAGVFDWERVMKEAKGSRYIPAQYGMLRRQLGDPKAKAEFFEEISPLRHVQDIRIPIYVAHGTEDVVASVEQSKRLISELKKHGVPFEKQIEGAEGHGFQNLKNRVELYTAIEAFLAKHLAAAP